MLFVLLDMNMFKRLGLIIALLALGTLTSVNAQRSGITSK